MNQKTSLPLSLALEMIERHSVPRIEHPLGVASLVLRYGGSLAQAQAALVHDALADGVISLEQLNQLLGSQVADLARAFVEPLTDTKDWLVRKKNYLDHLKKQNESALFVVACEELYELNELLHALKHQGAKVWKKYPVHSMQVFWYYRELLVVFNRSIASEQGKTLISEFATGLKSLQPLVFD